MIPTLRVVAGPDLLRFVSLMPGQQVIIGRDPTAGLMLSDASVSRSHAVLNCDQHGEISIQDQSSTNGTSVNGRTVHRALLRPGDHVEIGAVSLRLDLLGPDELGHLAHVIERLEAADRDPLTGLLTRVWLQDELPRLLQRCHDAQVPISVAFCDLDRFKIVNDTFGHGVGDEVLRAVARLVMVGVRDTDFCLRFGGDEVLIFLPGTSAPHAIDVAERLRRLISGHDWSRTCPGLHVSASFGVAEHAPPEEPDAWLARADIAMFSVKNPGRPLPKAPALTRLPDGPS